jgi:hypothetical protein
MFRRLAALAGAAEAARRFARSNPDKASKYLDQAAAFVDKQTKGRYSAQIKGAADKARGAAGIPTGGTTSPGQGTTPGGTANTDGTLPGNGQAALRQTPGQTGTTPPPSAPEHRPGG